MSNSRLRVVQNRPARAAQPARVTLPILTSVQVRAPRDKDVFVSAEKIPYVQERADVDIGFLDPSNERLKIPDEWLTELNS